MAEHTRGPWRVDGDDCLTAGFPFIAVCAGETGPDFRSVAEVQGVYDDATDGAPLTEESRANAHLIAAAPELLEALERLLATIDARWPGSDLSRSSWREPVDLARAAVAKARGQS